MAFDDAVSTTTGTIWRVEMLGGLRAVPLQARDGWAECGEPVEQFRTHKSALLLAYFALSPNHSHAREALADRFWPDAPTERGRANLTQTLVYLRQALHEPRTGDLFTADHRTIRVAAGRFESDAANWEVAAKQALADSSNPEQSGVLSAVFDQYKGDLLPGFYDEWVCDARSRLADMHDALRERLQALQARAGAGAAQQRNETLPDCLRMDGRTVAKAPLYLTRFFGRESECSSACRLLCQEPSVRLLTLQGMGGIGKTRLALEIGRAVLRSDRENAVGSFVWAAFVPLAEARTAAQMEGVLLHVLGVDSGGTDEGAAVAHHLKGRASLGAGRVLLILDNLEQLGNASAAVVARLLAEVSELTIVATSRQPVGIPGEQELPVGPLSGAAGVGSWDVPAGVAVDVQLFADRVQLVRPRFALTAENEPVIVRLCALLEGIPLALELAAAWARVLTPAQITERLGNRFGLLSARRSGPTSHLVPERHQSLHAAIAWSYDLLEPELQRFFAQLSVFRGGWTADAAQAVTGISDVSEFLLLLAERSLILNEPEARDEERPPRYWMLESLREFAGEQLTAEERERLCGLHAGYFVSLCEKIDQPEQFGARGAHALLQGERDNLRAAIVFALGHGDDHSDDVSEERRTLGIRLVLQSASLWPLNEVRHFVNLVVDALPLLPEEARKVWEPKLLLVQGGNAIALGDLDAARRYLRESLARYEELRDGRGVILCDSRLANLCFSRGDTAGAIAGWTRCLAAARETGEGRLEAAMLNNLGIVAPDLDDRRRFCEEAVALDRIIVPGSRFLACSLNTLGNAAREQGDFRMARRCFEEGYAIACADGSTGTIALLQTSLVELFLETRENLDRAGDLLCDAQKILENSGELPRVVEVFCLRFRLALALGDSDAALEFARRSLQLSRQNHLEGAWILDAQADMLEQLRTAGFLEHAARLADSTDG